MIRKVVVNGRPMDIDLRPDGTFRIDGQRGVASLLEVQPGTWSVLIEGRSYEARLEESFCTVNGVRLAVELEDPRSLKKGRHGVAHSGRQTLTAAMPGKVVRVLVSPGDQVEAGQGIAVVEAMKMQNEVKAVRPGRVVSVAVSEGATVGAGAVLAVID